MDKIFLYRVSSTKSRVSVDDKVFLAFPSTKQGFFVDKIFLYSVSSTKWGFFVDGAMVFGTIPGSNGVFSD